MQAFQGSADELLRSTADLATALTKGIGKTTTDCNNLDRQLKAHFDMIGEPS